MVDVGVVVFGFGVLDIFFKTVLFEELGVLVGDDFPFFDVVW